VRCEEIRARLDDWAEGTLPPQERRDVAAHLATCAACAAEARELKALLAAAAELPLEILPPRDLWAGIDARLDAPGAEVAASPRRPSAGLPGWALVAAALALVVVTAAVSSLLTRRYDEAMALKLRRASEGSVAGGSPASGTEAAGTRAAGDQEARFLAASQELLDGLERQNLAPETMEIVRRNVATIDAAIVELHAALERDPGNGELNRMLLATYQRKIDLLEQAARSADG
jgi:anti-sigma factor RsiW